MSKATDLIGKVMHHRELGKVEVTGTPKGSRTRVEITVVQRAKGWDESTNTYRLVKTVIQTEKHNGKSVHYKKYGNKHSQFGHEDICHISDLREVIELPNGYDIVAAMGDVEGGLEEGIDVFKYNEFMGFYPNVDFKDSKSKILKHIS